jgi:formylglycine-generating enzyme required for sulfatase activity
MALIDERFCIDQWEASLLSEQGTPHTPYAGPGQKPVRAASVPGVVPQGYISLEQAERACDRSGKKLCSTQQWVDACMGSRTPKRLFPYGNKRAPGACNDSYRGHPVDRLLPGKGRPRDAVTLNDPRINQLPSTVALTGSHPGCATPEGVFDLSGNLLEWTRGPRPLLMGGHYIDSTVNGPGCTYVTPDHDARYADFTTGFRCCAAAAPEAVRAWKASGAPVQQPGAAGRDAEAEVPVPEQRPTVRGGGRSFDNASGVLPEPAPAPGYETPESKCPSDMVHVQGVRCARVKQECLRWVDPPGAIPGRACGEFARPTECEGGRSALRFCIDRYEFTAPGESLPLVHVSFPEAENLCRKQAKRMCEEREWEFACEGPEGLPFPYGYERDGARCNHDRDELFVRGKLVDRRVGFDALPRCASPFGVYNMVGNVDEWVLRAGNKPPWRSMLKGGWWLVGRSRCRAVTDTHAESYAGPQTGFRCCKEAR